MAYTRKEANKKILELLGALVDTHPEWRFHQILMNYDVEPVPNPDCTQPGYMQEDRFYEESTKTLDRLNVAIKNEFNKPKLKKGE